MLYYYPATSLDQNWLNPTIIEVLLCGMDAIDAGGDPADWPDCIPVGRRETLPAMYSGRKRELGDGVPIHTADLSTG